MTSIIIDSSEVSFIPENIDIGDVYFLGHDRPNPGYCICIVTQRINASLKAMLCKVSSCGQLETEHLHNVTFYKLASSPESSGHIQRMGVRDRRFFQKATYVESLTEPFAWKCAAYPCLCKGNTFIFLPHGEPKHCGNSRCEWIDVSNKVRGYILATHQLGVRP